MPISFSLQQIHNITRRADYMDLHANGRNYCLTECLWRAPELLRNGNASPAAFQKGDIYSFGIILYEIHGRAGPWGKTEYSPKVMLRPSTSYTLVALVISDVSHSSCTTYFMPCCPIFYHSYVFF